MKRKFQPKPEAKLAYQCVVFVVVEEGLGCTWAAPCYGRWVKRHDPDSHLTAVAGEEGAVVAAAAVQNSAKDGAVSSQPLLLVEHDGNNSVVDPDADQDAGGASPDCTAHGRSYRGATAARETSEVVAEAACTADQQNARR